MIIPQIKSNQNTTKTPSNITLPQQTNLTKFIQNKQPKIDPTTAKEIAIAVEKYAEEFNFPPELIICIIARESSFRPILTSSADCKGLMQINEKFHKEKLRKLNIKSDQIFHIDHNIHLGCMILREYYNKTKTISGALTKYVGGNHKTYKYDILSDFTDLMIKKNNFKK